MRESRQRCLFAFGSPAFQINVKSHFLAGAAGGLTEQLRNSTTVAWQIRDSVRAKMRILIKHLLKKYKYPPEGQEEAVTLVLKQAEALADMHPTSRNR